MKNKLHTDTEIKSQGMKVLIKNLGMVEAEKFVALIQREPFDYTEWQRDLWKGNTATEISKLAMDFRNKKGKASKSKKRKIA
ncbi:MAG: hypothetical protein IPQ05_22790 [Leptospiraceae bacterium]|nr:hypothetical protein [Leptospiraceae bacterium]MBL0266607.1 hypothetical protein [Leptospiraceae bacterium]